MAEAKREGIGVHSVGRVIAFGKEVPVVQLATTEDENRYHFTDPRLFSLQDMVRMEEED